MKTLLFIICLIPFIANSQEYIETVFDNSFGKQRNEQINDIKRTSDNNFFVTGYTDSEGKGGKDIWVAKLSPSGEILWQYVYGNKKDDEGFASIENKKGFVTIGYSIDPISGYTNGIILSFDKKGKLKQKKTFATSSYTKLNDIAIVKGSYFVTGILKDSGNDNKDIFVAKLNSNFSKIWIQTLGKELYTDEGLSIKVDNESNIYIAGYSMNNNSNFNAFCAKLDNYGKTIYEKTIISEKNEKINSLIIDKNNEIVLVGQTNNKSNGDEDMLFVKLDNGFNEVNRTTFGNYKTDVLTDVIEVNNGYLAVGYTQSLNKNIETMYMLKFDYNGKVVWERANTKYYQSKATNIIAADDNSYIVVGSCIEKEGEKLNAIFNKYKSNEQEAIDKYIAEKTQPTASDKVKEQIKQEAIAFYSTKEGITLLENNDLAESTDESKFRGSGNPLKGLNVANDINNLKVGKYYALIIGIDEYSGKWNKLDNAVNDAKAIERVLKTNYKFTSFKTLYNSQATRTNIINSFEQLMKVAKEHDNVFIYYSGHGDYKKELNKGYWVPVDAKSLSTSGYISNSDLQTYLSGIKAKHTLLVADACFSGDIFRGKTMSIPFENSERYYKKVYSLKSRQAMTSGGIEPVMDGGKDGHSVFAYYLLKSLKGNNAKMIDAGQVFDDIKIPVYNNSDQSPDFKAVSKTGDEGGQFIFIKK